MPLKLSEIDPDAVVIDSHRFQTLYRIRRYAAQSLKARCIWGGKFVCDLGTSTGENYIPVALKQSTTGTTRCDLQRTLAYEIAEGRIPPKAMDDVRGSCCALICSMNSIGKVALKKPPESSPDNH